LDPKGKNRVGAVCIDMSEQRLGQLMRAWQSLHWTLEPDLTTFIPYHPPGWRHEMPTKTRSGVHYDPTNIISEQIGDVKSEVKWEKALWRKQPFPDSYVPSSFLAELKALRTSNFHVDCVRDEGLIRSSTPTPSTVDFDLWSLACGTAFSCYRFVSGCF